MQVYDRLGRPSSPSSLSLGWAKFGFPLLLAAEVFGVLSSDGKLLELVVVGLVAFVGVPQAQTNAVLWKSSQFATKWMKTSWNGLSTGRSHHQSWGACSPKQGWKEDN
jgi:hypothetical protein